MSNRIVDIIATVATRFGGKSINLIVFIIVLRNLSLAESAVYGFVFSSTLILSTMLDIGLRNSSAIFIGRDPSKANIYTRQSFFFWLSISTLSIPLTIATLSISNLAIEKSSIAPPTAILLVSMLYLRIMQGPLLGTGDIKKFNKSELASRVVLLVGTLAILAIPNAFTLDAVIWTLALSQTIAAAYLFFHQRHEIHNGAGFGMTYIMPLLRRGFIFMLSVLLTTASKRISFFAINHYSDEASSGLFFGLQRLTEVITEIGMAVAVVAFSYTVRAKSEADALDSTTKSTRICISFFALLSAVLVVFSEQIIPITLGSKFEGNDELFLLLLIATLFGSIWSILFPSLSATASPTIVLFLLVPGVSLNILSLPPLIAMMGLNGAAISMAASNLVITVLFLNYYRIKFKVPPYIFLIPSRDDINDLRTTINKAKKTIFRKAI